MCIHGGIVRPIRQREQVSIWSILGLNIALSMSLYLKTTLGGYKLCVIAKQMLKKDKNVVFVWFKCVRMWV
jgi:hypothetical protein